MDDYSCLPITLRSGKGSNLVVIRIDEWGSVRYEWVNKTWSTHVNNAFNKVKSIARKIVGEIGSFFGSRFGSKNHLEGPSKLFLTYN